MLQILYSLTSYVFAAFLAFLAVIPADTVPVALLKMADTERAFAKQAADTTIWAAFVEYFADESVNFDPIPGPARDRLRKEPSAFPKELRMKWEPRVRLRDGLERTYRWIYDQMTKAK